MDGEDEFSTPDQFAKSDQTRAEAGSLAAEVGKPPAISPWEDTIRLIPATACLFIYFVSVTCFTVFETIGTPLTEQLYGWKVFQNGLMYVGAAAMSVIGFIGVQILNIWVNDKVLLFSSMLIMACGFGILIPPNIQLYRFIIGCCVISFVLPMAQSLVLSIFSKVLNKEKQSTANGFMVSAASFARVVGPIWATQLLDRYGSMPVFITCSSLLLAACIVQLVMTKMLTTHPSQVYEDKAQEQLHAH